jgi:hypothetical protein
MKLILAYSGLMMVVVMIHGFYTHTLEHTWHQTNYIVDT